MMKKMMSFLMNLMNMFFMWLTMALALMSIFKKEWMEQFMEWMKLEMNWLWLWNFLMAWTSSLMEAFPVLWVVVPGQNMLLMVWGFFWNMSNYNLMMVMMVASMWAMMWNYIWYALWAKYWDNFFTKYWNRFWMGKTEVKYMKKWMDKWGAPAMMFWKFHPMTSAFLPFMAWTMWMKSKKFMLYNTMWSMIRAMTMIVLWVVFVTYYKMILEYIWYMMTWLLMMMWIYMYMYKKKEFLVYLEEKNKEMEELVNKK